MRLSWVGVAILGLTACGGSVTRDNEDAGPFTGGSPGSGGSGGSGAPGSGAGAGGSLEGTGGDHAVPPDPDPSAPPANGTPSTLAANRLWLGDVDWNGNPSSSAWKEFGFDIDGRISTKTSVFHCQPVTGANPATVLTDGDMGIDNSFGGNLLPLVLSLSADASNAVNESISAGEQTLLFHFENLQSVPDQSSVLAAFLNGAHSPARPAWDGTDRWPVAAESVIDGDLSQPRAVFPESYTVRGTWVSGASSVPVRVPLWIQGFVLPLLVHRARFSAVMSGVGFEHGIVGGVLETEELIDALWRVAGALDVSLCTGSTFESIAQQIRTASDIMIDGTQNPNQTCNAISIGLGFSARHAQLGGVLPPELPPPDPCAP